MSKIPIPTREQLSIEGLQSQFSNLMEKLWHCGLGTPPLDGQDWAPRVELRDESDRYLVLAELPGVARSAIEVSAQSTSVVLSGEKAGPAGPDDSGATGGRSERRYGAFRRQIDLPGGIEVDKIPASLADGVLELVLPKAREGRAVNVQVKVE